MSIDTTSLITFINVYLSWPEIAPGELAAILLLTLFSVLVAFEATCPNKNRNHILVRRSYCRNVGMFIVNSTIVSFISAVTLLLTSQYNANQGLLNHIPSPILRAVLAFLCFDLLFYLWHQTCHRFDCLWQFHRVHHSDPMVNVTTAFRVHIVELLLTTLLKSVYILVLGLDKSLMLLIEGLFTGFVMLHHSNVTFPHESWLGKLIITPYLHRTHHSTERSEHDSNYGAVLSLWDRLFRTKVEAEPAEVGISTQSPQTILGLISFGFGYADHAPESTNPNHDSVNLKTMIAEAAYYKAEKRAFSPGNELSDWLEAKKEIFGRVYGNHHLGI